MVYHVIGLMSGSSLDGLDICYAQLEEIRGKWSAQIINAECYPYSDDWVLQLRKAKEFPVLDFLRLHTAYGRYTGQLVNQFIANFELQHKVHFVSSHGHTIVHDPHSQTTFQLGDGASIAATIGLPVISDLRALDVAYGGQGAPIVPIGDQLLFSDYGLLLNIGGIANISIRKSDGSYLGFDVCVANQALNFLAKKNGKDFDELGSIASQGKLVEEELVQLGKQAYYYLSAPKSLSNELAMDMVMSFLENEVYSLEDRMHTMVHFIVERIYDAIIQHTTADKILNHQLIATGGGAFNTFLMKILSQKLAENAIELTIPDTQIVAFKEALVMALIGTLRWREEANVLANQTGALKNSIGGAYWIGA